MIDAPNDWSSATCTKTRPHLLGTLDTTLFELLTLKLGADRSEATRHTGASSPVLDIDGGGGGDTPRYSRYHLVYHERER